MKPVSWNRLKESELVGMTLIELLLVFIFAFLLVLNIYYRQSKVLKADVDEVQHIVSSISQHFPADAVDDPDDFAPDMSETLEELKKVEEAIAALAEADAFSEPDLWRIVTNKGGLANVIDALKEFEEHLETLEAQNDAMEEALAEAGLETPDVVAGGKGDRPGNCWYSDPIRKRGDQYLLHVTILEDRLIVRPAWPEERAKDAELLPIDDLLARIPGELSGAEFMRLTRAVFDKSVPNNCRYFVRVFEKADTKRGFQDRLREIESRFYKYPENF